MPFLCYELFVLFRWLIQLELQIGLSHMPIGLKESGIQKHIGHKIFPLSSLRVLQYVTYILFLNCPTSIRHFCIWWLLFIAVHWRNLPHYEWWTGTNFFHCIWKNFLFQRKISNISLYSFAAAEKSDNPALHVEWNEKTLLLICEKVLPWSSW